ncbi:MAG: translation initiation factor [Acidobacteria bacterium]|nr:translation initiation factor [Acidobacteriota bacterium]
MPEGTDVPAGKQTIRISLDRKRRRGKTVTVASGFELTPATLENLAKELKKRCGAGGKAAGGEIEIQGDHVESIRETLRSKGFRVA